MNLYTIPDLVFEDNGERLKAETPHGDYLISKAAKQWVYMGKNLKTKIYDPVDTLETAKAAANEHNRQMMERGLEAVETTEGE